MACPNCESKDTRITEHGFVEDSYYCNNCGSDYKKLSKVVKGAVVGTAVGVVLTPIIGPLGPIIGGIVGGGGDNGA